MFPSIPKCQRHRHMRPFRRLSIPHLLWSPVVLVVRTVSPRFLNATFVSGTITHMYQALLAIESSRSNQKNVHALPYVFVVFVQSQTHHPPHLTASRPVQFGARQGFLSRDRIRPFCLRIRQHRRSDRPVPYLLDDWRGLVQLSSPHSRILHLWQLTLISLKARAGG
jgi:hypothetical protein